MTRRQPTEAIAAKRAEAEANSKKITDALIALQEADDAVNVRSVAAAAGVSPNTLRSKANTDLLKEVTRIRDQQTRRPQAQHARPSEAASYTDMKAKWMRAQSQVIDLRAKLDLATQQTYQAIGISHGKVDPDDLRLARKEITELTVELSNASAKIDELNLSLKDAYADLEDARELAGERQRALDMATNTHREERRAANRRNLRPVPTTTS